MSPSRPRTGTDDGNVRKNGLADTTCQALSLSPSPAARSRRPTASRRITSSKNRLPHRVPIRRRPKRPSPRPCYVDGAARFRDARCRAKVDSPGVAKTPAAIPPATPKSSSVTSPQKIVTASTARRPERLPRVRSARVDRTRGVEAARFRLSGQCRGERSRAVPRCPPAATAGQAARCSC